MAVKKTTIFSACCGGCGIVIFIIALAVPWFYFNQSVSSSSVDDCTQSVLYSWSDFTCSGKEGTICECFDDSGNWRDECEDGSGDCGDLESCFDTAGAFVGLGFLVFLVAFAAVIFVNILEKGPAIGSKAAIVLFAVAGVLTMIAVIQFPSQFPDAYEKAQGCPDENSPCDSFVGSTKYESSVGDITVSWGSAGWGMALAAVLVCIINVVAAVVGKRK